MNLAKQKGKMMAMLVVIAALVVSFFWSGNDAVQSDAATLSTPATAMLAATQPPKTSPAAVQTVQTEPVKSAEPIEGTETPSPTEHPPESLTETAPIAIPSSPMPAAETEQYLTAPVEPQDAKIGNDGFTCTISVRCDTILNNIDKLDAEKMELVPEDGVILASTTVTFYEGESVFNVLQREMKGNKIHLEFVNTPVYNSAYIEGINNLYEFDCGERSGWMYRVNGWYPNYGCSRYQLQQGDMIEWIYTCDLGRDIGGEEAANKQ